MTQGNTAKEEVTGSTPVRTSHLTVGTAKDHRAWGGRGDRGHRGSASWPGQGGAQGEQLGPAAFCSQSQPQRPALHLEAFLAAELPPGLLGRGSLNSLPQLPLVLTSTAVGLKL